MTDGQVCPENNKGRVFIEASVDTRGIDYSEWSDVIQLAIDVDDNLVRNREINNEIKFLKDLTNCVG